MDRALRILLVEDAELDAELQFHELRRSGLAFEARRVQTEADFLAQLGEHDPDIIVSDYSVPGFGGLEALEIARQRVPDLPFIFVSGAMGEDMAVELLQRGATDYVLKTNLTRLTPALTRAIRDAEAKRARRKAEQRVLDLSNLYAALSEANAAIARAQERDQLLQVMCRIAVTRGGFLFAWAGLIDAEAGMLVPAATFGNADGLLDGVDLPVDDGKPGGRQPAATAAREGRADVCNDTLGDSRIAAWHERMRKCSIRSAAAVPLMLEGKPIGSFSLYAKDVDHFDEERMQLLRELAGDIAFALDRFEQESRRRRAEAETREARQQLQALSTRLIQVQEQERRDIAHELHDEIGQSLTLMKIKLQMALHRKRHDEALTGECVEIASQTLEQVRAMSLNLRPPALDDLGLSAALQWALDRQEGATGWKIEFKPDPIPQRLAMETETACFRVAQEALTNAARHSKAKTMVVQLRIDGDELQLTVKDDGIGFDQNAVRRRTADRSSLGLISMKERAALAGGRLEIESESGSGTRIVAVFPLRWRNGAA
ncbi:MAG TPA: GAF domain-containing protein [Burkholderiales bacterium]|nr:GAF domain-containing protein [Burkholderiales bacterium]